MSNLFKKAIMFTDLHLGLKGNSKQHNQDCLDFVDWAIKVGKERNCETCFFLGDWHNNRSTINVATLHYSLAALEKLSRAFDKVYFLPGNHDTYYRDKRDIQSVSWAKNIPNIRIVDGFFNEGDVSIVPWLVGDEHKKVKKISAKYMMGHFELPHFYMNAMVRMPDSGELKNDDLKGVERVFSGHFHKRQTQNNITYIGNCFGHNYSDAGDDARGVAILDWDGEPEYISWPAAPTFRVFLLSDLLTDTEQKVRANMFARVNLDIDISYEEAGFIRESLLDQYKMRELTLIPIKAKNEHANDAGGDINFESIDTIVTGQLAEVKSEFYDSKLLLEIWQNL